MPFRDDQIYCSRKCRKRSEYIKKKSGIRQFPQTPQSVPNEYSPSYPHSYFQNAQSTPENIPDTSENEYISGGHDNVLMDNEYTDLPEQTPEVDLSDTLKDIGNPPSNDQCKQLPTSPLTTERLRRDIEKELLRLNSMVCDNTTDIAELRESLTVSDEDEFYDYFEDLKQNRAEQIFTNVEDIINANLTDIKKYILCQIVTRPFVIRLLSGTNIDHLESLFSQAYKLDDIVTRLNQLDESKKAIIKTINNLYKRQRLLMNGSEDETTDVEQLNNDEL